MILLRYYYVDDRTQKHTFTRGAAGGQITIVGYFAGDVDGWCCVIVVSGFGSVVIHIEMPDTNNNFVNMKINKKKKKR